MLAHLNQSNMYGWSTCHIKHVNSLIHDNVSKSSDTL